MSSAQILYYAVMSQDMGSKQIRSLEQLRLKKTYLIRQTKDINQTHKK